MGQILLKKGVKFGPLSPGGAQILSKLKEVVAALDFDVTITSANDSKHSKASKHYIDEAFDLRTNTLTKDQKYKLLADLKDALYKPDRRFYAILEADGTPNQHIHVQVRAGTTYDIYDFLSDL